MTRANTTSQFQNEIDVCIRAYIRSLRARQAPLKNSGELGSSDDICVPYVCETRSHRSLHFSVLEMQSQMLKRDPTALVLDYTRTMMGFLMFNSQPERIAMIGLGGGSLAKFCYKELPRSRIEVVEINPHVVALRDDFHVPPNNERFCIHIADGAQFISRSSDQFDVLLVDAYSRQGLPPRLAAQRFYDNCRTALREGGIMVMNLYCEDADEYIGRIRRAFAGDTFVVDEEDGTNRVVFARRSVVGLRHWAVHAKFSASIHHAATELLKPEFSRIVSAMQRQNS